MTLASNDRYVAYTPTASTTGPFDVDFPIFNNNDLKVFIDGVSTVDFTVSSTYSDGRSEDATVTLTSPIVNQKIEIFGKIVISQDDDLPAGGAGIVDALELQLDRLTAMAQESQRDASADSDATAAKLAAEAAQVSAEAAAASVSAASSEITSLGLAAAEFVTSNETDDGTYSLYTIDRGAGTSVVPASGDRVRVRVHDSSITAFPVKIRLSDGVTPGAYSEVKVYAGSGSLASLGVTNDANGRWWFKSAQLTLIYDGTDWAIQRDLPVGEGSFRIPQLDSNGDLRAHGGHNLTGVLGERSELTASGSDALAFALSGSCDIHKFYLSNLVGTVDDSDLYIRFATDGATFLAAGNYGYSSSDQTTGYQYLTGQNQIAINGRALLGNDATFGMSGEITVHRPGDSSTPTFVRADLMVTWTNGQPYRVWTNAWVTAPQADNAIQFTFESGAGGLSTGTIKHVAI